MEPEQTTAQTQPADDFGRIWMDDQGVGVSWNAVLAILLVAVLGSIAVRRFARIPSAAGYRRWFPVAYTSIWGVAIATVTMMYARTLPGSLVLVIWLVFLVLVFASVGWLRSVMSGVAIAVEGRINLGDSVRVDSMGGEVIAFGLRSVRIRAVDGTVHEVPNEKFVTETVSNLSAEGGDSACEIVIKVPPAIEPSRALELAREAAILSPLASPRYEPEVFLDTTGEFDESFEVRIRGYAFDASYTDHFRSDVVARIHDEFVALLGSPEEGQPGVHSSERILLSEE